MLKLSRWRLSFTA